MRYARLIAAVLVAGLGMQFPAGGAHASQPADLALVNATIYPSPNARALERGTIVIHDGAIAAVGPAGTGIPRGADAIDCAGKVITAGFWNSHVHFTEDVWNDAATAAAPPLNAHLREMLTQWGFTTVFDLGSNPASTLALRRRIESGELTGPRILTTAGDIFPENGIPMYLPKEMAAAMKTEEAATPADAARLTRMQLGLGADGIKLFTGAIVGRGRVTPMPVDIVRAAVELAHAAGKPVFAHPSNHAGTDNALEGGVDVLAHTIPSETDGFTPDEVQRMLAHRVGLIPTLTLWEVEAEKDHAPPAAAHRFASAGARELHAYFKALGPILFGTDVGYTQHYDTAEEYKLMAEGGMQWRDILAALTTAPAAFFKDATRGRVETGLRADLAVLDADPTEDVANFARVAFTIGGGRIVYGKR
jgi:imidazolonepropionase-like amidohydrolase